MFTIAGTVRSAVPDCCAKRPDSRPDRRCRTEPRHRVARLPGTVSTPRSGVELVPIFTKHVHQWNGSVGYLPAYKALLSSGILMRFGREATDGPLPATVDSSRRPDYLPSLACLASALCPIQPLDLDLILPRHGPALTHDIPRVLAGAIAHCEAAAA
ncbi:MULTISPECIES: hypothetical protein [Burkholderia]|uniref:MBL fold metallo-hydrolase n=1 Tax=Burkholderia contaminans TaxID=488447 RepID=A0A6P2YFN9_9BURK|nr:MULTISPECIES: hypothetical protein [Burkholderia]MDN7490622.1 hypothetical protein [Burkholderia sp. AU45274]VWD21107.1 MBL fold metallo-hydrolase [Burkholderia contaminans]